ncbi:unnamed protein product [Rotaria sp. Silwood2]|nr:unnamed protein product [Rotaria sp. Silwood2]CAF2759684.1 unnamed protein product [Rotaria sp. Silwood2]CAF3125629.1 unnamed protein product [Rotaria sp. Silwood2]CAF3491327.1 unnamed protein product [Rotaria sp. Silwood2]CAF4290722.1 unnamed protein product [Rotaria sp. Silwood2]
MVSNETNLSLWPCLHSLHFITWSVPCTLSRLGGIIILSISVVCFTFNIRFLCSQRCRNSLVVSLFLASLFVIMISVPGVLVQLFTCHRHCLNSYCRIEGFFSYLSGCLCMLIFTLLSIHRYLSLCSYDHLLSYRCSTFICWLLSIAFTFPLIFDYLNSYLPEGLGFHCSINWKDQSNLGRLYILSSFILMYLLPLAILLFVNIRAHLIIRNIYSKRYLTSSFSKYVHKRDSSRLNRQADDYEKIYVHKYCVRKATDRKRFRMDYRFLRAIVFLVSSYLIAWTPYSVIAILQLLDIKFISQHPFLITLSAFIAKLSVILTPFVYLSIMNYKLFKKILFK